MTLCFAWKSDTHAFIVTDAAITSSAPLPSAEPITSFGETVVSLPKESVSERAVKVNHIGNAIVAFAGDCIVGHDFCDSFASAVCRCMDPQEAMHTAIRSCSPFDPDASVKILLAYYDGGARLLSFDTTRNSILEEEGRFAYAGSLAGKYVGLLSGLVARIPFEVISSRRQLATIIGFTQSLGTIDYLMEDGVGGVVGGMSVGPNGVECQPDTIFFVLDAALSVLGGVAVVVRDGILVADSTFSGPSVFCNTHGRDETQSLLERMQKVFLESRRVFASGRYEFVTFLSRSRHIVTVVEMKRHLSHASLEVKPVKGGHEPSRIGVGVEFGQDFRKTLTTPVSMKRRGVEAEFSLKTIGFRPAGTSDD